MKSTNNMQKKETDKPTSEQAQKKEVRRNNAPDFI
ncbi:TPA: lpg0045 family Dot/Icm T4SS effector, partial [Legionella pneumophila]|nr:lpg0045 family Dot/Icm T4SS effector [Legionella pneumophila]